MDLFNFPQIDRMTADGDLDGLRDLLAKGGLAVRLRAAYALAGLEEGSGWRYLLDSVRQVSDPQVQITAAELLGDLGHLRAIPALEDALTRAKGDVAEALKGALEAIGGPEADDALRRAGYAPVLPHIASSQQMIDYGGDYVRTFRPDSAEVQFLTAEEHFNNAVALREAEQVERALTENSLALWLQPDWAYAWYLRGVLFEELERPFEAALAYRWALELDPEQADASEALNDMEFTLSDDMLDGEVLLRGLKSRAWQERRDSAAGLGDLGEDAPPEALPLLLNLLVTDEEREVRHAVIEALGNIEDRSALQALTDQEESSWLLRFAIIEALAQLRDPAGLVVVLRREMSAMQERNTLFTANKDVLLEVEYDRMMEVGALALERSGDLAVLLDLADEGQAADEWAETEDEAVQGDYLDEEEEAIEESLESFTDETALLVSLAIDRLALPNLASLDRLLLERLALLPDLTLPAFETDEEQPAVLHDHAAVRNAAVLELARRV